MTEKLKAITIGWSGSMRKDFFDVGFFWKTRTCNGDKEASRRQAKVTCSGVYNTVFW